MTGGPFRQTYNVGTTASVSLGVCTWPVGRVTITLLHCFSDGSGICTHWQTHESRSSDARDIPAEGFHDIIGIRARVAVLLVIIGPSRHATFDNVFKDNSTPGGSVQSIMVSTRKSTCRETGPRDSVTVQHVMNLAVIAHIGLDCVVLGHEVAGILGDGLGGSVAFIVALPLDAGSSQSFLQLDKKHSCLLNQLTR